MDMGMLGFLKAQAHRMDEIIWDNGLLRRQGYGHTREVADLKVVHAGPDSSIAYVYGKITGTIDENTGRQILEGISTLQVRDAGDERYGAFRWYIEESKPIDTNAAFFIMAPLAILSLFSPASLSSGEARAINDMLEIAYNWFSKECRNPILFYTNKIISDGALLTAIGKITGAEKYKEQSREFLNRWLDYTHKRGYGWGENLSRGYNGVTLQAFALIKKALDDNPSDRIILEQFNQLEKDILDTFRFFDGYEFVPTIRSYNVNGLIRLPSTLSNLAGVRGFGLADGFGAADNADLMQTLRKAITFMIYDSRLYIDEEDYIKKGYSDSLPVPRTKQTHIMDDKYSYSWMGSNGGLGSINKFPVIDGSYQHKTWGLGWQCFPVSAIVYDKQVSFLRFNADCGDRKRNHPHKDKHRDFLDPSLFSESYYPDVKTDCSQCNNTVIAIRSINKLRNRVKSISDSFDVQRFDGEVIELDARGRKWIVLSYENASICLTSLKGISGENEDYHYIDIEVHRENEDISLVQQMYIGKLKTLFKDRLCTGWVIHFVDRGMTEDEANVYLDKMQIRESCVPDGEIPRMPIWNIHSVDVLFNDDEIVSIRHDPYL